MAYIRLSLLTREGPLDVHLTFRTSDGGVGAQVGAYLAPVSVTGECAWCGVYTAAEVGVYKNVTEVQIFFVFFLKATKGLSQKAVPTVALFSRICQLDRKIRQTGRLWGW